jgi:hypothetical protein
MHLPDAARKGLIAIAALGALALGGSAVAGAASGGAAGTARGSTAPAAQGPGGPRPDPTTPGGHVGSNGRTEQGLPSDIAAKVRAAAAAKVQGTVLRVETDVDHGSPYEAHVRRSDGTELEVLVDKDFNVTAVNTMQHP